MAGPSFFLLHGYALWSAWSLVGLFQIATNRYFKHKWESHLWMHRLSGVFILVTTLFYGLFGIYKLQKVVHDPHAYLGITVTALVLFIAVSGVVARSRLNRAQENQSAMLKFKKCHIVSVSFILLS